MSLDIVDDLHAAEDLIGMARMALEAAKNGEFNWGLRVREALGATEEYCRPSCHGKYVPGPPIADKNGTLWDDEACDDDCGCPCGHNGEEPE